MRIAFIKIEICINFSSQIVNLSIKKTRLIEKSHHDHEDFLKIHVFGALELLSCHDCCEDESSSVAHD
jgi:hypothetical protein